MIYLASPYTSPSSFVRRWRFLQACKAAAELMRQGNVVFSPICHSHPIALHGGIDPNDGFFWKKQDAGYIRICRALVVLTLPGWEESVGVCHEIREARQLGKPVTHMVPGEKK